MDLGIQGKRAIVTGGSRGIGREIARALLEAGARVLICARAADTLERTGAELRAKTGGEVEAVAADMAVEAEVERVVREADARLGGVDILVNNAGQMYSGRFDALTEAGLQAELNVATEDEARRLAARKNALGRFGRPDELADAVAFLCSERASFITGVSLNVDGGRLKGLW